MKRINLFIKLCGFLMIAIFPLLASGCSSSENQSMMKESAPDGYNLDDLNNYGEWVHVTPYGDCWHPYVVSDWMPFNNGYWVDADAGWTWISYEPFGWIVYHYGYWYDDSSYGWVWIPSDNEWSPARVDWIDYDDFIGWAPLPPPGVVYGAPWESRATRYWEVVRKNDFDSEDVGNYRVKNPLRNTMEGREVSYTSPTRKDIETSTGRSINQIKIRREDVKIHKKELTRINLPPAEVSKVDKYAPAITEKVLIPRGKYYELLRQTGKERISR